MVSLKSRSIEAGVAVTRSRAAEKWLRGRGAGHVLFKICSTFNSTDAGNIGPVMDALRADSGDAIVLVTPAFPETGRTVYQGNLFVGAVPLNESPLKDHPLNPMHDSNLVRVLARQSKTKVGLVDLATLSRGAGRGSRAARRSRRARASAPPSSTPCSTAISKPSARVALDHRLSVGASGIGLGLARALVASGKVKSAAAGAVVRRAGRRAGGVPCRQLLAGDAGSRSPTPKRPCRCCISIPNRSSPGPAKRGARWPGRASESATARS